MRILIPTIVTALAVAIPAGLVLGFYYDAPAWFILSAVALAILMAG